ncbi:MAG: methyl-accepting chemotaxis protein [Butyrivibrio sp.]|nr:methyl-accepting chemotaxis protein [Butyrivibrio sp.]
MAKTKKKVENRIPFKNSIKTRLISLMLAVAIIPLAIAVLVSYFTSTKKALADAETSLEWQAMYLSTAYSDVIRENLDVVRVIADNPTTIAYMEKTAGISDEVMIEMMQAADNVMNDGSVMAIADTTGMQIVRSGGSCVDVSTREYWIEAMKGNTYISNILVSKSTGARQVTIAVPIKGSDGSILGEVQRNYDLEAMHQLLATHTEDAFVCDREGVMAAHAQFSIAAEDVYDMSGFPYFSNDQGTLIDRTSFEEPLIMSYYKDSLTGYTIVVSNSYNDAMSSAVRAAMVIVIIGIILSIGAIVLSFRMVYNFMGPIKEMNISLSKLAEGKFYKITKFDKKKDEFGLMVGHTNAVISKLEEIVGSIKTSAQTVESSSLELSDMANQISQTADDVSNAVQEIASGATQQADEIQNASENVGYIGDAVVDVQSSAKDLEGLAGRMQEASEASSSSLTNLQESSNEMTGKIEEISTTISATQDAVSNINDKVEGIASIATQTNLLSLNASIEAARAGDAGKGFAVVAEEIGKLADDSKTMADEIRKEMDVLLEQSMAAVAAAEEMKNSNFTQQSALGETLTSVNGMIEDIASTVGGVQRISNGADTCESSKNAVVDTMSALSAISEENAASSEETGASMEELSATVTTLAGSANDLKDIAEKLNKDMSFFDL